MNRFTFKVTDDEAGIPVKKLIRSKFGFSSRMMSKIKYQDLIRINGKSAKGWYPVASGDLIRVLEPEEVSRFEPEDIPIDVLYEDHDLLIINKQPGITVHPTKGHPDHTIANGIMNYMNQSGETFKIRFINRLDMDTSGILLVGKNSNAQFNLTRQMAAGLTEKEYIGLAGGVIEKDSFIIDEPIGRPENDSIARKVISESEGGQSSQTIVEVLERFPGKASLVRLRLLTGRTHQIRVHMSYIGHPLVGDSLYGGDTSYFNKRQALHSFRYALIHPVSGKKLEISAPLPCDMRDLIDYLRHQASSSSS
jgi:23S rRNA pseudouridine1911/1915/1917 synthase